MRSILPVYPPGSPFLQYWMAYFDVNILFVTQLMLSLFTADYERSAKANTELLALEQAVDSKYRAEFLSVEAKAMLLAFCMPDKKALRSSTHPPITEQEHFKSYLQFRLSRPA
jgi:hypothetical protein